MRFMTTGVVLMTVSLCVCAGAESAGSGKRITTPYMTKYEKARVLGTRALQIR